MTRPSVLLADIGGQNCRFALTNGTTFQAVHSIKTSQYDSFEAALQALYPDDQIKGLEAYVSFARKRSADGWYALDTRYKETSWRFHPDAVCARTGLSRMQVVHDFYAMGLAVLSQQPVFKGLRVGQGGAQSQTAVIIGPGSGLGHAYVDLERRLVADTHGGHMPPAVVTESQWQIAQRMHPGGRTCITEDILGGAHLFAFYQACCSVRGLKQTCARLEDLLPAAQAGDAGVKSVLAEWCGWLGLYANVLATSAFAYRGIYLCGGVTEKLCGAGQFDTAAYLQGFHQTMVLIVDADLRATPHFIPATEHTTLYGLLELLPHA